MNTPSKILKTPNVVDFDAAWFLVYTSGKRIIPMELIKLKIVPPKINIPATISALLINDNPPFNKARKGNGANKGENPD